MRTKVNRRAHIQYCQLKWHFNGNTETYDVNRKRIFVLVINGKNSVEVSPIFYSLIPFW